MITCSCLPLGMLDADLQAKLVPQLGKSCADKPSAACLCDETKNGQLSQQHTVMPAPVDRITAAANQVADDTETKDTTKSAIERRGKMNKQVFWSYHMPVLVAHSFIHFKKVVGPTMTI